MTALRTGCVGVCEVLAQSIAMLGPTLTPVLIVPLMFASAGNALARAPLDDFNDTATLGSFGIVTIYAIVTCALLSIPAIGSVYPVPPPSTNAFRISSRDICSSVSRSYGDARRRNSTAPNATLRARRNRRRRSESASRRRA